eukprot:tig00020892_g14920.t1
MSLLAATAARSLDKAGAKLVECTRSFLAKAYGMEAENANPLSIFNAVDLLPAQARRHPAILGFAWESCRKHSDENILRSARCAGRNDATMSQWRDETRAAFVDGCAGIISKAAAAPDTAALMLGHLCGTKDVVEFSDERIRDECLERLFSSIRSLDFEKENTVAALIKARNFWIPAFALRSIPVVAGSKSFTTATSILSALHQSVVQQTVPVHVVEAVAAAGVNILSACFSAAGILIKALATHDGRDLVEFLKRVGQENDELRHLIDAVEEHNDMFSRAETFKDLIDVRRYLQPLLKLSGASVAVFLKALLDRPGKKTMAGKIHVCSANLHGLERLYDTIANRSEVTKSAVRDAVQSGVYLFTAASGSARLELEIPSQRRENESRIIDFNELQDIRSRALLILSSRSRNDLGQGEQDEHHDAEKALSQKFIDESSLAEEVFGVLVDLQSLSGHYREWSEKAKGIDDLRNLLGQLKHHRDECSDDLDKARSKSYCLLFFRARQIWSIFDFVDKSDDQLEEGDAIRLCNLLRKFEPGISVQAVKASRAQCRMEHPMRDTEMPEECFALATEFVGYCAGHEATRAAAPKAFPRPRSGGAKHAEHAERARLFIAAVDRPEQVANALFSLCMNDGHVPARSQVLFCSPATTMEDVHLLIERCRYASKNGFSDRLFCIVNAELLDYHLQIELSALVRQLQQEAAFNPFRLAIICCRRGAASEQSQILTDFAASVVPTTGLSEDAMREVAEQLLPHVILYTSAAAGLGKSEEIRLQCLRQGREPHILTISGVFSAESLARRLNELELNTARDALHIDVGQVDSPQALNLFLLELLFLRSASAGDETFHLPALPVYVEIGNTASGSLLSSLSFCGCLPHTRLQWSTDRIAVSTVPSSPDQVVCRYLQALESGRLSIEDVAVVQRNAGSAAGVRPIPLQQCRALLRKYFFDNARVPRNASFSALRTFINVLACQLVSFSKSPFFKVRNLAFAMAGNSGDVRALLLGSLIDMAAEFASLKQSNEAAVHGGGGGSAMDDIDRLVDRFSRLVQWSAEENNHLLVLFHPVGSITALYRDRNRVPDSVRRLIESQSFRSNPGLTNYGTLKPTQLLEELMKLLSSSTRAADMETDGYVMTLDNLLKMGLILTRVRARVPVVVMGETGCGKTSLIRFLAKAAGVPFAVLNFHAGITERHIEEVIEQAEEQAADGHPVWVFLDEINTSDSIGLVGEIICQHTFNGRRISGNIAFLAACNPYKKRLAAEVAKQRQAGLKLKQGDDPMSKLVYRVHPLPEKLADYVWDFGSLTRADEEQYIQAMVETSDFFRDRRHPDGSVTARLVVSLLVASQHFMSDVEGLSSISLRDVRRCIFLMGKFLDLLDRRLHVNGEGSGFVGAVKKALGFDDAANAPSASVRVRAVVLALAHCYHSRLAGRNEREHYRELLGRTFRPARTANDLLYIIQWEQRDYLRRMELPPGTAMNEALLENVFVLLICIIHCIPVFLVGKPGCSKSLSMRLIYTNLRGPDSRDPFFRTLPQLYFVSFQGSEQSTSDGILKVFEKARRFGFGSHPGEAGGGGGGAEGEAGRPATIPVVLLDEVGLAEVSRFNPLKVLHALLEPGYPKVFPDVAVVGISNWQLDPAKMNRAIHLSRPEPDEEDLYRTAKAIIDGGREADRDGHGAGGRLSRPSILDDARLRGLARAYHEHQTKMKENQFENFHGLRDYYCLVKSLAKALPGTPQETLQTVVRALHRNFGGLSALPSSKLRGQGSRELAQAMIESFVRHLHLDGNTRPAGGHERPPVLELIRENWIDTEARHLLVASGCDATMGILQKELAPVLAARNRSLVIIVGSAFPDDVGSEDYMYRVLSRIILSMEAGNCVILKDLNVYGSLYDMLNQNYSVVGSKRNCRVALGAYSNPMCHVDEFFRCIVVVDRDDVEKQDPPFLNRFEKQVISYEDILTDEQRSLIRELQRWVENVSACTVPNSSFDSEHPERSFCGFNADTLPSLVRLHSGGPADARSREAVLERCKADLINTATEDCIVRLPLTRLGTSDPEAARRVAEVYRREQEHGSLAAFMKAAVEGWRQRPEAWGGATGVTAVVYTFSQPTASVSVGGLRPSVVILGAIKREADFVARLKSFWSGESGEDLLVVQCSAQLDRATIPLARYLLDQHRDEYAAAAAKAGEAPPPKHALIVVHLDRSAAACSADFSHLGQWRQVTVDSLEPITVDAEGRVRLDVQSLLGLSVAELLQREGGHDGGLLDALFAEVLQWAFSALRYRRSAHAIDHVKGVVAGIRASPAARAFLKALIVGSLRHDAGADELWARRVASSFQDLAMSMMLGTAVLECLRRHIRTPLAKIVFALEREEALATLVGRPGPFAESWHPVASDLKIDLEDLSAIPEPRVEGYAVLGPFPPRRLPFSRAVFGRLEEFRDSHRLKLEALRRHYEQAMDEEEAAVAAAASDCLRDLRAAIASCLPSLAQSPAFQSTEDYVADFAVSVACASMADTFDSVETAAGVVAWLLRSLHPEPFADLAEVHAFWWGAAKETGACVALLAACKDFVSVPSVIGGGGADAGGAGGAACTRVFIADRVCRSVLERAGAAGPGGSGASLDWLSTARFVVAQINSGGPFEVPPTAPIQLLRICTELAACFRQPRPQHRALLREVVDLGREAEAQAEAGGAAPLPASASFVAGLLRAVDRHAAHLDAAALARFECALFLRCVPLARSSTELLGAIAGRLLGARPRATAGSAAVLRALLTVAAEEHANDSGLGLYGDALLDPELVAASPALSAIDGALAAHGHPPDSEPWAFVCDLLLLSQYARIGPEECATGGGSGGGASRELAQCFLAACRALAADPAEADRSPLRLAMAAAFVRALARAAAPFLVPLSQRFDLCEHVERALAEGLDRGAPRLEAAKVAVLRAIRDQAEGLPLQELRAWCSRDLAQRLPWARQLPWRRAAASRLDVDPFANEARYAAADRALDAFVIREAREDLGAVLAAAHGGDAGAARGLLQAALACFYLSRASAAPTDREAAARAALEALLEARPPPGHAARLLRALLSPESAPPAGAFALPRPCWLDLQPGCDLFDLHLSALLAHAASVFAAGPADASPFHALFAEPGRAAALFVPGAPSNEQAVVARALQENGLREANRWYRHACGYWYSVGACGRPMQMAQCPNCGQAIGGANHVPAAGNEAAQPAADPDQPGIIPEDPAALRAAGHTERGLHPAVFRVLHLLTYLALAAAARAGLLPESSGRALFHNGDGRSCLDLISGDVGALGRIFGAVYPDPAVFLALHGILRRFAADVQAGGGRAAFARAAAAARTAQGRRDFEREFAHRYVQPLVEAGAAAAAAAVREECRPREDAEQSAVLEAEILEDFGPLLQGDYAARFLPRVFATVHAGSADGFRAAFRLRPENARRFPVLALLLESEGSARALRRMWALAEWSRTAAARLQHAITRAEAAQKPVARCIEEWQRSPEERAALEASFAAFVEAWNELRPEVTRFECLGELAMPEMTVAGDAAIALCLPERKDSGLFLCIGLDQIACVQNHLLTEAAALARQGHAAVAFLATSAAAFGQVPVQDATEADLCAFEVDDEFARRHALPSLALAGAGRGAVDYDFGAAEAALAAAALAGRRLLQADPEDRARALVRPFVYHLELFPRRARLELSRRPA